MLGNQCPVVLLPTGGSIFIVRGGRKEMSLDSSFVLGEVSQGIMALRDILREKQIISPPSVQDTPQIAVSKLYPPGLSTSSPRAAQCPPCSIPVMFIDI